MSLYFFCSLQGIHIVPGPLKNAETRPRRSTDGSDGSDARGVRRRLYCSRDRRFRYAANRNGKCRDVNATCGVHVKIYIYLRSVSRRIVYAVTLRSKCDASKVFTSQCWKWYISINSTGTQKVRSILTVSRFRYFLAKFHLFKFANWIRLRLNFVRENINLKKHPFIRTKDT